MAKRMLVDATQPEETRVVVVNGNRLEDMDFEIASRKQLKGNIYLAKVTRVEPSLQAAFVEYGGNRHGFLAFAEIHPDYYRIPVADREALLAEERRLDEQAESASESSGSEISHVFAKPALEAAVHTVDEAVAVDSLSEGPAADTANGDDAAAENPDVVGGEEEDDEDAQRRRQRPMRSYKIQEVVKRRQVMLVQVTKEERGNKGAALTTYLSLPGRYCVLMPNTGRGGGISRKITNPADRKRLKEILSDLDIPEGMAVILRTAGLERSKQEIKRDLEYLLRLWDDIREQTLKSSAPCLIYEEANLIKRSIRDLYADDIDEIWIEGEAGYQTAKDFMRMLMPGHSKRVLQYRDETIPLFHRYQVETQIDAIHSPVVQLKSGGYIVINPTEALVSIDVNSGKSTRERNIEETAYKTNLEAADEVARQLRLRDLAGLIVIDFIDMEEARNNAAVERRMKEAMKNDRARIQLGRISAFGLLELSRQRLRPSLLETNFERCPHCAGTGVVRSVESAALHVLRAIEEEGIRKRAAEITTYVNSSIALYILNQKRTELTRIEERYRFKVMVQADDSLIPPDLRIERVKARLPEDDVPLVSVDRAVAETDRALAAEAELVEDEIVEDVEAVEEAEAGESQAEAADADGEGENERRRRRRRRRRGRNDRDNGDRSAQTGDDAAEAGADEQAAVPAAQPAIAADTTGEDLVTDEDDEDEDGEAEGVEANSDLANGDRRKRRRGKRGGRRRNRQRELENGVEGADQAETAPVQIVPLDDATLDAILTGEVPAAAQAVQTETVSSEPVVEAPAKPTRRRTAKKAEAEAAPAAETTTEAKPTRRRTAKKAEAEVAPAAEAATEAKPTRRRTAKKAEAEAAPAAEAVTEAKPARGRKAKVAAEPAAAEAVAEAKPARGRKTKKAEAEAAPAEAVTEAKPTRRRTTKKAEAEAAPAAEAVTEAKPARGRKAKVAAEPAAVEAAKPTRRRTTKKAEAEAAPAPVVQTPAAVVPETAPAEPAVTEKPKRGWWAR